MYHKKAHYNSQKREPGTFKPVKKAHYNSQKREPCIFKPVKKAKYNSQKKRARDIHTLHCSGRSIQPNQCNN